MATYSDIASGGVLAAGSVSQTMAAGALRTAFEGRKYLDTIFALVNGTMVRCVITGLTVDANGVIQTYLTNRGSLTIDNTIMTADDYLATFRVNVGDNDNKEVEAKILNCLR